MLRGRPTGYRGGLSRGRWGLLGFLTLLSAVATWVCWPARLAPPVLVAGPLRQTPTPDGALRWREWAGARPHHLALTGGRGPGRATLRWGVSAEQLLVAVTVQPPPPDDVALVLHLETPGAERVGQGAWGDRFLLLVGPGPSAVVPPVTGGTVHVLPVDVRPLVRCQRARRRTTWEAAVPLRAVGGGQQGRVLLLLELVGGADGATAWRWPAAGLRGEPGTWARGAIQPTRGP